MSQESPLRAGARVGSFVVLEEIGVGATSVVYEAEHRTLRHRVAIKVLRASTAMDNELRRRFEREMHLLAHLASVHVPHVYDVGELPNGLPYIVMERLSGATLAEWLAAHRRLPLPLAVEIGAQVCSALGALHEAGALHRDVKPENIFLHREPAGGCVVKLVDFGICKPVEEDGPPITLRGTVVGTPEYMSPEQVGGQDLDERTDVYSTGVVLYELLAGRTPFEGRQLEELGRAILVEDPPRLGDLCPECPPALETIVMRAMARNKKARFASMSAFRHELERFADDVGLRRHPRVWSLLPEGGPGQVYPLTRHKERNKESSTLVTTKLPLERRSVLAGAALVMTLIGGVAIGGYYIARPRIATAIATVQPRVSRVEIPQMIEPAPIEERVMPIAAPSIDLEPAVDLAVVEPSQLEVDAGPSAGAEEQRPTRAERRRRARAIVRARPARRSRDDEPTTTTIALAPLAPQPSTVSQEELYAQVGAPRAPDYVPEEQPDPPSEEIPSSPYEEGSLPNNPF